MFTNNSCRRHEDDWSDWIGVVPLPRYTPTVFPHFQHVKRERRERTNAKGISTIPTIPRLSVAHPRALPWSACRMYFRSLYCAGLARELARAHLHGFASTRRRLARERVHSQEPTCRLFPASVGSPHLVGKIQPSTSRVWGVSQHASDRALRAYMCGSCLHTVSCLACSA